NSLSEDQYHQMELFNNLVFDPELRYHNRYFANMMTFMKKFSFLFRPFLRKETDELVERFEQFFENSFIINKKVVQNIVALHVAEYYFFKWKLKRMKPKLVIASQWFTGMVKAANELGIDTAEIQH